MAAVEESPNRLKVDSRGGNTKKLEEEFQFDMREDAFPSIGDLPEDGVAVGEDDSENKMYDMIIQRVLSNPKIDKRTLLQKFISKIEMESNIHKGAGGLSSELAQIKRMMEKNEPSDPDQIIHQASSKQHAISHAEPHGPQLLQDTDKGQNEGAQSMQQIKM